MNSFNHWAFGAVGEWMWRTSPASIPTAQPGYKHFVIRPRPGGGVTWAKAQYDSIRGRIASDWKLERQEFTLKVTVPPNTSATVYVPAPDVAAVTEGGRPIGDATGVKFLRQEDGCVVLMVGSGDYAFAARQP